MIQTPCLNELIKESLPYKSLGESFLAVNNNAEFMSYFNSVTATIFSENDHPVGFGSIVACNNRQAYVMLGEIEQEYQNKTVWVEELEGKNKSNLNLKITKSVPHIDYSGETHFEQTFANRDERPTNLHLLDALIDNSIGLTGLDVHKNVTVDIVNQKQFDSWRDTLGFVVSDKNNFERITVNRFELLSLENEDNINIVVEEVVSEKICDLLEYDSGLSIYDRQTFLESLIKTGGNVARIAKLDGVIVGYIVHTKDNILQCYGNTEEIQRKLLSYVANGMNSTVKMYIRKDSNITMDILSQNAIETISITRLNSRTVVNSIKWNKIACINMGLHLF